MHRICYSVSPLEYSLTTPVHYVAYNGNLEVLKIFLPLADINKKNSGGYTALHLAAGSGHTECVQALLTHPDINVNEKNEYEETALHDAAVTASARVVTVLLESGVDVKVANCMGATALYYALNPVESASETDKIETAQILVKHMCKMEAENLDVNTSDLQLMDDHEDICDFVEDCRKELEVMKGEEIGCPRISFLQILLRTVDEIAICARDEGIRDVYKSQSHLSEFPIYGTEVDQKFKEACKKAELQLGSFAFLKYIVKDVLLIPSDLPKLCFDELLQYLTDEDMSNMIEAKPIAVAEQ